MTDFSFCELCRVSVNLSQVYPTQHYRQQSYSIRNPTAVSPRVFHSIKRAFGFPKSTILYPSSYPSRLRVGMLCSQNSFLFNARPNSIYSSLAVDGLLMVASVVGRVTGLKRCLPHGYEEVRQDVVSLSDSRVVIHPSKTDSKSITRIPSHKTKKTKNHHPSQPHSVRFCVDKETKKPNEDTQKPKLICAIHTRLSSQYRILTLEHVFCCITNEQTEPSFSSNSAKAGRSDLILPIHIA